MPDSNSFWIIKHDLAAWEIKEVHPREDSEVLYIVISDELLRLDELNREDRSGLRGEFTELIRGLVSALSAFREQLTELRLILYV